MTSSRVFVKNVIASVTVRLLVPLSLFILFVVIARFLGVEAVGKYTLIVSLFTVFQFLASLGLNPLIIREIAQQRETPARIYTATLVICLFSCLLWAPCLVAFVFISHYPQDVLSASFFLAAGLPFAFMSTTNEAVLMGMERFEIIPFINLIEAIFLITASLIIIRSGRGIVALSAVLVCGKALSSTAGLWLLLKKTRLARLEFDRNLSLRLLRLLPPFFVNYAFGIIFYRIDVLMLSVLVSERDLGLYSTAYKLFSIALILPDSFSCAIYPRLSKAANSDQIHSTTITSIRYALLIMTPPLLAFLIFDETLITSLFGEQFSSATVTLDILLWLLLPQVTNSILSSVFLSCKLERITAVLTVVATGLAASLCIPLVHQFGFSGAAVSLVITQTVCLVTLLVLIQKRLFKVRIFKDLIACSAPAILGGLTVALLTDSGNAVQFVAALIIAAIIVWILKLLTKDEVLWFARRALPRFLRPAE